MRPFLADGKLPLIGLDEAEAACLHGRTQQKRRNGPLTRWKLKVAYTKTTAENNTVTRETAAAVITGGGVTRFGKKTLLSF